jgi:hypothetical protein
LVVEERQGAGAWRLEKKGWRLEKKGRRRKAAIKGLKILSPLFPNLEP